MNRWHAIGRMAVVSAALGACAGGTPAAQQRPKDLTYAEAVGATGSCLEGDQFPRVLTVDWRSDERVDVEVAMKRGIAVVAYDCQGLRLLPDCRVEGAYGFVGVTLKQEAIRLENVDEVRANLPLHGAGLAVSIGGELERGATLDIALALVGKRAAARSEVSRDELVGQCTGATHFVRSATVGAFVMSTGQRAKATTAVEILSIGAGASSESDKQVQSRDGNVAQCQKGTSGDEQPPDQCGALVRLDLAVLGQPVPTFEHERAAAICPKGFVLDGEKCTRSDSATVHPCQASQINECFDQCDRGEPRSCTLLSAMLATGQGVAKKSQRKQRALERQVLNKKIGPWKKKSEEAEREIEKQESRKVELEALMADPELYGDQEQWGAVSKEYGQVGRHLERAYQKWEEAQQAIEAIEKETAGMDD